MFPNAFFIVFFTRIGDRKAYQPDGMMLVVHFLQQLLCQWKNGIERGQLPGLRNAAGDLTEIMELDFQRQRISPEILIQIQEKYSKPRLSDK